MHITKKKRRKIRIVDNLKIVGVSIGFALISLTIIPYVVKGVNPIKVIYTIFRFSFVTGLDTTISRFFPFFFLTLAFIIPMKAGVWNVGAESQFLMGGLGAVVTSYLLGQYPRIIAMPLSILVAMGAGAGMAGVIGYFKGKYGSNEIVLALMLNLSSIFFLRYLISGGPLQTEMGWTASKEVSSSVRFIYGQFISLIVAVFIVIGVGIGLYYLLKRSSFGYQIMVTGESAECAIASGVNLERLILLVMITGGCFAGFAGFYHSAGVVGYLTPGFSSNWGYFALVYGLLANLNILLALPITFFYAALFVGANQLQIVYNLWYGIQDLVVGVTVIVLVSFMYLREYELSIGAG